MKYIFLDSMQRNNEVFPEILKVQNQYRIGVGEISISWLLEEKNALTYTAFTHYIFFLKYVLLKT